MKEKRSKTGMVMVVLIGILIVFFFSKNCKSKSDYYNGTHRSDWEMNRVK